MLSGECAFAKGKRIPQEIASVFDCVAGLLYHTPLRLATLPAMFFLPLFVIL